MVHGVSSTALTRLKRVSHRNLLVPLSCVSSRGGKVLCGGKCRPRYELILPFSVKVRYAQDGVRNKLHYRCRNLLSVQNQPAPSKLCSVGALHAKLLQMGGRVYVLVYLPLASLTVRRVVPKCGESFGRAGLSLAGSLAWHHGYVANTLIVSAG